ncbi:MAG: DUF732 domain-containing protein [Actinomycetota bacterium]|nr:DUF732 domain-containing protein [Actinomycetota bacterium]
MIRHRRTVAAAMVAAGLAMFSGAGIAHADTDDERFEDAVTAMGIPLGPDEDLPLVGKHVCDMLTQGFAANAANPVPVVRGVVNTLANTVTKEQAVGLMRASVVVYCPQYGRFMGR